MKGELPALQRRKMIVALENELLAKGEGNGVVIGNSEAFPLTHSFAEGIYIREMFMRKDAIIIGAIHLNEHIWFLMKGEALVATEEKTTHYKAPCYVTSPAGCKRVITAIEDSVFINVLPNPDNLTDIEELEKRLVCKSYEEFVAIKKNKKK